MEPTYDPTPLGRYLTLDQLAAELGVSINTIYKWSRRGRPDFPRSSKLPNGRIVVARTDLEAWLAERAA